jgi:hypothetical protein
VDISFLTREARPLEVLLNKYGHLNNKLGEWNIDDDIMAYDKLQNLGGTILTSQVETTNKWVFLTGLTIKNRMFFCLVLWVPQETLESLKCGCLFHQNPEVNVTQRRF